MLAPLSPPRLDDDSMPAVLRMHDSPTSSLSSSSPPLNSSQELSSSSSSSSSRHTHSASALFLSPPCLSSPVSPHFPDPIDQLLSRLLQLADSQDLSAAQALLTVASPSSSSLPPTSNSSTPYSSSPSFSSSISSNSNTFVSTSPPDLLNGAIAAAAERGHASLLPMLVEAGAQADALVQGQQGPPVSPLFLAAQNGHAHCVETLLSL